MSEPLRIIEYDARARTCEGHTFQRVRDARLAFFLALQYAGINHGQRLAVLVHHPHVAHIGVANRGLIYAHIMRPAQEIEGNAPWQK